MGREINSPSPAEKERIRAEIENQVNQFLRRGGQIDVVAKDTNRSNAKRGSIWQNLDEEIGLSG